MSHIKDFNTQHHAGIATQSTADPTARALKLKSMAKSYLRAFVSAHEGFDVVGASGKRDVTYSGYAEAESQENNLASPEFATLAEVIGWALEKTDFVVARDIGTPYFWAGVGEPPIGLPKREEISAVDRRTVDRLVREPNSRVPSDWLRRTRAERNWSVQELAVTSGVSEETISKLELGEHVSDGGLNTWVKLVCALEGRRRKVADSRGFAIFEENWLEYAFEVTETSLSNDIA